MSSDARLKQNFRAIQKFEVNGYKPYGFISLFWVVVATWGTIMGIYTLIEGGDMTGLIPLLLGIACFVFLILRNRKLQKTSEIIKTTIFQILIALFLALVAILWVLDKSMEQARQQY